MIKNISIRELRPCLSKVFQDVHDKFDRYVVSRRGKPEVVIMSIEDYESLLETIQVESDLKLMKNIKKAEKEISLGKGKKLEDLEREWGLV